MATRRLALVGLLVACGGDGAPSASSDASFDPVLDTPTDVDASEDSAADAADADVDACAALFDPGFTFELDRSGEPTQIHADAVFDGEMVVAAYVSRSTTGEGFDLWLARATCGALAMGAPVLVESSSSGMVIEPQLARGPAGDYLLVWQVDDGSGADNLSLWSRSLDADLNPTTSSARIPLSRAGVENVANTWMPSLEATETGYALAGAWAHSDAERFQVFVQKLDAGGAPDGDAIDLELEPLVTQTFPAIAVSGDEVGVIWDRAPDDGEAELRRAVVDLESRSVTLLEPLGVGSGGAVAHTGAEFVWGGAVGDQIVVSRDGESTTLGATGTNIAPVLVRHSARNTVGVVWYRIQSGFRNDLFRHELALDGSPWERAVGQPVPLDAPAAPYSPVMIEAGPGWFLAWSSGQSPELRLFGRYEE